MDWYRVFRNVGHKDLIDYYTVELVCESMNNHLVAFKTVSYVEASEIFNRVLKELKKNNIEDENKKKLILAQNTLCSRGNGWMNLVQAERKNNWNVELVQGAFYDNDLPY